MDIEQLIRDTFIAHEHLAPVEHEVMRGVHDRIDDRRAAYSRPIAIAASVAVVAGIASSAVALSLTGGSNSHQARRTTVPPVASPSTSLGSTPALANGQPQITTRPLATPPPIQPLTMPFDLTGLPAGNVQYIVRRVTVGGTSKSSRPSFGGEYMLTVSTPKRKLDIDVQQMPGASGEPRLKSGAGRSTIIDGRRAVESRNSGGAAGYEVFFRTLTGSTMYVTVALHSGGPGPAATLTSVGRRVASGVRFPGATTVKPSFGIGYLPAGLHARGFDISDTRTMPGANSASGLSTSYDIGTLHSQDIAATVGTDLSGAPTGTAGRAVQGHPSVHSTDNGYTTLDVLDAVEGHPIAIQSRLPLLELYRIADGLRLPS